MAIKLLKKKIKKSTRKGTVPPGMTLYPDQSEELKRWLGQPDITASGGCRSGQLRKN